MITSEEIASLFAQNNGILKTVKAMESGVPKSAFYAHVKKHGTEQMVQGAYFSPDTWTDVIYLLYLRCNQAAFSYGSASFSHDLTDREPEPCSVMTKIGYNPTGSWEDGIKVYTIKKELHGVGVVSMSTPFGSSVPVYGVERIVRNIIRSRSGIEMQVWQDILKQYVKYQHKDLRKLMRYARMFHVKKLLRQYLEVLL